MSSTPTCPAASRPIIRRSAGPGRDGAPAAKPIWSMAWPGHSHAPGVHRGRGCRASSASAASTNGSTRLLGYCEAPACRRTVALLDYFGERNRGLRQLRCLPRSVGAHRRHGGCPENPVGGLPVRGTLRRGASDRPPARGGDGEDRALRPSPPADLRGGRGPEQERVALAGPPDGGDRVSAPRHRGLWRARHRRQGPHPAARRGRIPVPRRHRDGAQAGAEAGGPGPGRRPGGGPGGGPAAGRRRGGAAGRAEGAPARPRAGTRGARLCRVSGPRPDRHGAPPAAQRGGVRRGQRRRRGQAEAVLAGPFLAAIEAALPDTGDGAPSAEGAR